jgi:hypothetical protein
MSMNRIEKDEEREERIMMEAIVDAYNAEEQALGWYYYLEERVTFPFQARCVEERGISPLREAELVSVVGMAPEQDCRCEMFVKIEWQERKFGVPLAQLSAVNVDEPTQEAIADWHYWVRRGYRLA